MARALFSRSSANQMWKQGGLTLDAPAVDNPTGSVRNLQAAVGSTPDKGVITWQNPSPVGALVGYRVGRDGFDSANGGAWSTTVMNPALTTWEFTLLVEGSTYNFTVVALYPDGVEGLPVTITYKRQPAATPPPPVIPGGITFPKQGISPGYTIMERNDAMQDFELDKIDQVRTRNGIKYPCFVRLDSLPGNQGQMDRIMPKLRARGLTPYIILFGTWKVGQSALSNIGTFPRDQVLKWGDQCNFYEICNEPDEPSLGGTWPVNQYADFVKACAAQIRAVAPNKRVIAGSLFNGINESGGVDDYTPDKYVTALCQRAAGSFDFVSLHCYGPPRTRAAWNEWDRVWPVIFGQNSAHKGYTVREILDAHGMSNIPIISTENGDRVGSGSAPTEQAHADIVDDCFDIVADGNYAPTHMVYCMMNDATYNFGLLRDDFSERPAFHAFRARCVA